MADYTAPLRDMRFAITELADLASVVALPGYEEASPELIEAVLEEAGKMANEVLSPLNWPGDRNGAKLVDRGVVPAPGFGDAYARFVENGWCSINGDPEFGGQGLPGLVATATAEMWNAANMAFALCPMLTSGAMEAIRAHASDELKATYLPKLISGEWTGTMNLTEPQAGSDLAAVRSRAVPDGDAYRIYGQKIFITWGDHDMTENVIHLVLARLPDAPEGTRGISLFLVPKFLVNADGSLGARNDAYCTALEHKLGIHASPTCVMSFGDGDGAIGYLVGDINRGLNNMFTMMNEARQKVGIQGLAIADRAYQAARDFAKERIQGRIVGQTAPGRLAIIHHPDVRRMLLTMKSQIEAMRGFGYVLAADIDIAHRHPDEAVRMERQARVDLLIPVLKGWCTELGIEIASLGVQVHGGMGFIEETGAAQHLRDARIAAIYEGTTGIQAADLVGRKLPAQQGAAMAALIADMRAVVISTAAIDHPSLRVISQALAESVDALEQASQWLARTLASDPVAAMAASVNYMMLAGYVCGGWQLARAAQIALPHAGADEFLQAKITTAVFYAEQILPKTASLLTTVRAGASQAQALPIEQF
ncbi:MAG: acyl-CoA dehydrogenase C-terminal domain-containing protein [Acetobacteraceae bacterium]|nr:acyl-CoA dehydrogenase C-terminal domain-containing protein [Acetobacteraceae bacterium]